MWVLHACLAPPMAVCDPRTWVEWLEFFAALTVAFAAIMGFWVLLGWLGDWL